MFALFFGIFRHDLVIENLYNITQLPKTHFLK